ncbi:VCBS repeat-containing protein [Candidatus Poribacteria bacterium]|nr:VCBS repeat-containing protein [Candidatus Poribacteria bacterium]
MRLSLILLITLISISQLSNAQFVDVSTDAGVTQRDSTVDPDSGTWLGPGTAAVDYDNDSCWMDIFVIGDGGLPNALYHNNGDGTFQDIAEKAGIANTPKARGCVWFDYDNDGWRDLYVTCDGPNFLFANNGDGTFTDVSVEAGVADDLHGTSIAVADYDHDGWLDIYVANWGRPRSLLVFDPAPRINRLYRNLGDGTFEEVAEDAGVADNGIAWGAIFFDYDNDTWTDLFVANDHGPDKLYRNKGNGSFEDVSNQSGIVTQIRGKPTGAMGLCVGDYDNDKDLDLFVTNYDEDLLWRNNGDGTFSNVAEEVGVANEGVGWYASFVDIDLDGDSDLYVVNGDVDKSQKTNINRLYENHQGRFVDKAEDYNLEVNAVARGATAGDFDNDGDVDFYIVNNTGNTLLKNNVNPDNNRIKIRLRGTESNRDGIGARVEVKIADHIQTQELVCGTGFLGSDSLEMEFGLAKANRIDSIIVKWPSGIIDTYREMYGIDNISLIIITEGEASQLNVDVEAKGKQSVTWGKIKIAEVFQNYPNPFNPETWIPYKLTESMGVNISIFSSTGELIRQFNLGKQTPGDKTLYWDGKNINGEEVASGIYFYQFEAGNTHSMRKMWLIK